jgi:hypothetical protein
MERIGYETLFIRQNDRVSAILQSSDLAYIKQIPQD